MSENMKDFCSKTVRYPWIRAPASGSHSSVGWSVQLCLHAPAVTNKTFTVEAIKNVPALPSAGGGVISPNPSHSIAKICQNSL